MEKLSKQDLKLLQKYAQLIFEWNQKFNLTGHKTLELIQQNLIDDVVDSFMELDFEKLNIKSVLDVGSGSGSPGIIIAIMYKEAHITLVEANGKKCQFLNYVIKELELNNASVVNERIENLDQSWTEKFDLAVSRAVASIAIMNELLCKFVKQQKYILHLKSTNYLAEIEFANRFLNLLKLVSHSCEKVNGSNPKLMSVNVIYQKIGATPKGYPRPWKDIKKNLAS